MMRVRRTRHGTAALMIAVIATTAALTSCQTETDARGDAPAGPDVTCTVTSRPSVMVPMETEDRIEVEPGSTHTVELDHAVITLTYDATNYDVWSLRVDASEPGAETYFTRTLYQFTGPEPPSSFAGDTGFTGLTYLHPPGSEAEIQYLCRAE